MAAVIVPSHNGAHRLPRLLDSLRRQTAGHEAIVVDNGSRDGTGAVVTARYPEVRLVRLAENAGFGRAVNQGVAASSAPMLVLVNDDTICEPDFVQRLCEALDASRGTVMAAAVLLDARDPGRIDSAGVMFDRSLLAYDYLHGEQVEVLARAADPLGPTGGAAAFDRSAFEAVGGFDEGLFAYLEDVDLAVRLISAGGHCRIAPAARALHEHSATLGAGSRRKNELMGWSRGYTIGKYRLHRHRGLLARCLVGELAIVSGQLAIDRTWVGLTARIRGFLAGTKAPAENLPALPRASRAITLGSALRQRSRRIAARRVRAAS
jgi:GT2 family glycosyltransferase